MRVGHQRELAGIAIPDLQVFVVQYLEGVARVDAKEVPGKPFHLAAIAGKAESDAALALLRHGVVQIVKLAIADQVLSVGLREFLFRVVKAALRHLGCELGSDRVPVGIDDGTMFRSVRRCHDSLPDCWLMVAKMRVTPPTGATSSSNSGVRVFSLGLAG